MVPKNLVWFNEVGKNDVGLVGGKGANLGEMTRIDIPVPPGFIVTAPAYFYFLDVNKLRPKIKNYLESLDVSNPVNLQRSSENVKKLILRSPVPENLAKEIMAYYHKLKGHHGLKGLLEKDPLVAVRSSATAEDLPTASFAGQQATFLDIKGEASVVDAVRSAWASLFEARAIFYREQNHFDHLKIGIAVPVQKMVQSETSGIMFTISPVNNDQKTIVIEAVWGLGELIVQGEVTPDHYEIDKASLKISLKNLAAQTKMMVKNGLSGTKICQVPKKLEAKQKLTDSQILKLAALGVKLEKHYNHPQDIEFAVEKNEIYIVQTRPITTIKTASSQKTSDQSDINIQKDLNKMTLLVEGSPASPGIKSGPVKILKSAKEIGKIVIGDVLVAPQTNPDFVPAMKKAVAIVTDHGGRTSHAAIVSRELGIPAIVGTDNATKKLKTGQVVTVNGSTGKVYKGGIVLPSKPIGPISQIRNSPGTLKTATKVYVNLAEPEKAMEVAKMNVDGIGLLRAEFIMGQIGVHPKKIIADGKQKVFINNLAENLKAFAQPFYPRPVVYRATDFKTNEYRNLKGGDRFEPQEPNPMLGFRGAYRYIVQPEVFQMEIEAIKIVRNKFGLKNLWVMIPFVRTVMELIEVKSLLHSHGLSRTPSFHLWMMVEIPSNVILLDKFIEAGIDGVSIGSNDLTMMILGTDRDNDTVAREFDEKNPAVLWALEKTIKTCQKYKITSSICGQAPSVYPELVEKLVEWGVTSVSVSADAVDHTREIIYQAEKKLANK